MAAYKYAALAQKLRCQIADGVLTPGQRLPGENQIATENGYSRQTVRQALAQLEKEGLLRSVRGSGTFVQRPKKPLPKQKYHNVAVITTYLGEYIFPALLQGIDGVLSQNQCASLLACTHNRVDNERRILTDFLQKPIDGLIVEGTKTALPNPNLDLYERFSAKGLPVVFINGHYPQACGGNPLYVEVDDETGGRIQTEYLIARGHKNIAGLFKSDDRQGLFRYAGFASAVVKAGLPVVDNHVGWFTTENRDQLIRAAAVRMVQGCTAVVCYNDETAYLLAQVLAEEGVRVPQDVELVSFDHSTYTQLSVVPMTSLVHPSVQLGALAAQKLLNVLEGKTESPTLLPWGKANPAAYNKGAI